MISPQESDSWNPGIPGWSTDIIQFYDSIAGCLPRGAVCVELGVWYGRSACFLAEKLRSVGNQDAIIYGVDTWKDGYGWPDEPTKNNYAKALSLMCDHAPESLRMLRLLRTETTNAAALFADGSVDFLFVDADHEYAPVYADLAVWLPKVKLDGIVAGHDASDEYPGVIRAAKEFGTPMYPVGSVWRLR